jgi:hypothetical protein
MTSRELYGFLKAILRQDQFEFDDDSQKIGVRLPVTAESIKNFDGIIRGLFGNGHDITPQGILDQYKFNSEYIATDNDTIKLDKYKQLYADIGEICDKQEFRDKVVEIIESYN